MAIVSNGPVVEVAVIGAGAAGLVSAKELMDECGFSLQVSDDTTEKAEGGKGKGVIAVFEESDSAGGLWNLDPGGAREDVPCSCRDPDDEKDGASPILVAASSQPIYDHLKTNFAKDFMSFTDYPFSPLADFLLPPKDVANYYQSYAKAKGLSEHIRYNARVEKCWKEPGDDVWTIKTVRCGEGTNEHGKRKYENAVEYFRSKRLLVCTGHYRKAFAPDVRGLRHFRGELMHSSAFRAPEDQRGKSILIVGGGISGMDIAGVLTKYGDCRRIVVSVRKWDLYPRILSKSLRKKSAVVFRRGIDHIDGGGAVHFEAPSDDDGHKNGGCPEENPPPERPDVIIFATGYRYWYPFLPRGAYLSGPDGYKMNRLYMRVLSVDDRTLAFIGITNQNLSPAIMLEYQAKWYARVVGGKILLDRAEMEREVQSRSSDETQDALLTKFPSYCNALARMSGVRGYWVQMLTIRLRWHARSMWVRRHPAIYGMIGIVVPTCLVLGGSAMVFGLRLFKSKSKT